MRLRETSARLRATPVAALLVTMAAATSTGWGCQRSTPPSAWSSWTEPRAACTTTGTWVAAPAPDGSTAYPVLDDVSLVPMARVTGTAERARIWYPLGPRAALQAVELEDHGVLVRGLTSALATTIYATAPITMDGHLSTTALAPLRWDGATPDGLQLSFGTPTGFTPVMPPLVTRGCALLALAPATLPASGTQRTATAPGAMQMQLAPDRAIPLYASAGGPMVGTFAPGPARPVSAVARAVGFLRVIMTADPRYELDGWIDDGNATPRFAPTLRQESSPEPAAPPVSSPLPASASSFTSPPSPGRPSAPEPLPKSSARCTHDVPFAAGDPPRWVGILRAETPFAIVAGSGAEASFVDALAGTLRAAGRTWRVRAADLAGCALVP